MNALKTGGLTGPPPKKKKKPAEESSDEESNTEEEDDTSETDTDTDEEYCSYLLQWWDCNWSLYIRGMGKGVIYTFYLCVRHRSRHCTKTARAGLRACIGLRR